MQFLSDLSARHEALKRRIHGFRLPIKSRAGRFAMGCVYFLTPIVAGYGIMNLTNLIARENLGAVGVREKLLALKAAREGRGISPPSTTAAPRER